MFQKICSRHNVLLVLDEVATGFGRLGHMAEYTHQKSRPDIVSYGKMMTRGSMTMGATLSLKKSIKFSWKIRLNICFIGHLAGIA